MNLLRAIARGLVGRRPSDEPARRRSVSRGEAGDPEEAIKEPPMEIDARVMSADEFVRYVEGLSLPAPLPTRVFLHHTWRPTRESWRGLDTMHAMKAYYERQLWQDREGRWHEGWTAGPHLFIADDGIWLFSDLRYDGVGVYGHNYRSRHIEMVGDYDGDLPSGPTLANTVVALGILHERLGLKVEQLNFHRDFSTKSCPGRAVDKGWIIPQVQAWISAYRQQQQRETGDLRRALVAMIQDLLVGVNPQAALAKDARARGLLGALTHEVPIEVEGRSHIVQLFAEALLVPVNEWEDILTLGEYESLRPAREPRSESGTEAQEAEDHHVTPLPRDPYDFDGNVR